MLACTLRSKPGCGSLQYEDALTSTVFERLGYLPESLALSVLTTACPPLEGLLGSRSSEFRPIFWPTLSDQTDEQARVQPDVVLLLEAGLLVVEAKRPGGRQDYNQVRREVAAVRGASRFVDEPLLGVLLVEPQRDGASNIDGLDVPAFWMRWVDLADAVATLAERTSEPHLQRVLSDLLEGLVEAGAAPLAPLRGLAQNALPPLVEPVRWSGSRW